MPEPPSLDDSVSRLVEISGMVVPPHLLVGAPIPSLTVLEALGRDFAVIAAPAATLEQIRLGPGVPGVLFLTPELAACATPEALAERIRRYPRLVVTAVGSCAAFSSPAVAPLLTGAIPWPCPPETIRLALSAAMAIGEERKKIADLEAEIVRSGQERAELNAIGMALSTERNSERLLELILSKARSLVGADSGSLFLRDPEPAPGDGPPSLRFVLQQGDSRARPAATPGAVAPEGSIPAWVASSGETLVLEDAHILPRNAPYQFDREADRAGGVRTKSLLVVPLKDFRGRVLGVLELENRKKRLGSTLTEENVERRVIPFSERDVAVVRSLASQAAVALDNSQLVDSIRTLFEGFVTAAVTAIEQRDPTTSGHSERVAVLTCALAEVVDRCEEPRFRDVSFSAEQMRELRYASVLHDFGKVSVRESILLKAKKLQPGELERIRDRIEWARSRIETEALRKKLELALSADRSEALAAALARFDSDVELEWRDLDLALDEVLTANEPTVLPAGSFDAIARLGERRFRTTRGEEIPILASQEVRLLSIRKGSLDDVERRDIEKHVTQTYQFRSKIPWTPELAGVPAIAHAHHEKLDGRGYPLGLAGEDIPLPSRLMTVSDIYDALSASDRPYKKAVASERALDILRDEAADGMLDGDLVRLFIDARVWQVTGRRASGV